MAPSTSELLTQWNWAPSVLIGIAFLAAAYFYGVGPWARRRGHPAVPRQRMSYFILSIATLIVALLSPLDAIGDRYLFSAHMVQHLLLATLWAPLLLLSLPEWVVRPLAKTRVLGGVLLFVTYPAVAAIAFNLDVYGWHIPPIYDATLSNEYVHICEHLTFMGFGLGVWWPVLSPLREQRLSYPFQILYLFANGMFMMVLGILFTFAPSVFYHPYAVAPRLWGIAATSDQQLGGLVMWYPGNVPYAVALVIAFYRWFDGEQPSRPSSRNFPSQSPTIGPPASQGGNGRGV